MFSNYECSPRSPIQVTPVIPQPKVHKFNGRTQLANAPKIPKPLESGTSPFAADSVSYYVGVVMLRWVPPPQAKKSNRKNKLAMKKKMDFKLRSQMPDSDLHG